jgi:arylsulfatase A-like enzyme
MLACLDDAVGGVLAKLRHLRLENDTLIFFASDNGGPESKVVNNGPCRGDKWTLWEGGIRSPILVQWKGRIPGGRTIPHPVNQLDWLPTALAAVGAAPKADGQLDGVNLLPLLEGKTDVAPHDALYWRFGVQYAVRQGDWKLVKPSLKDEPHLFNVAADAGEKTDFAARQPGRLKHLQALWDTWNAKNEQPWWIDERWNSRDGVQKRAGGKPDEDE